MQLIERGKREARLTPIGKNLLPKVEQILEQVKEIECEAKFAQDPFAGELRMGVFPTLGPYLLPHIMPALRKMLPKLGILLIEEKTARLLEMIEVGEVDVACLALPIEHPRLRTISLFKEPFHLAVSRKHALAGRENVSMNDLQKEHILLLDEGHCLREQSLEVCRRIGVGESKQFRATSLETLRHMIASGMGVTFMPALAATRDVSGVTYIPIRKPVPFREIGLVFKAGSPRSAVYKMMMQAIRTTVDIHLR